MFTKKDLAERFHICENTVYDTIKLCGLDTSKREYTEEEIEEWFIPARKMLDSKKKKREVEDFFAMKNAKAEPLEEDPSVTSNGFMDVIGDEIATSIDEVVKDTVRAIVPLIPQMTAAALEEMARTGQIRNAFKKYRDAFVRSHSTFVYQNVPLKGLRSAASESQPHYEVPSNGTAQNDQDDEAPQDEIDPWQASSTD